MLLLCLFLLLFFLFPTRPFRRVVKVKASDTDQKLIFTNFDKLLHFRSSIVFCLKYGTVKTSDMGEKGTNVVRQTHGFNKVHKSLKTPNCIALP